MIMLLLVGVIALAAGVWLLNDFTRSLEALAGGLDGWAKRKQAARQATAARDAEATGQGALAAPKPLPLRQVNRVLLVVSVVLAGLCLLVVGGAP